ncbi:MAG: hypothetical protein ABI725_05580 [Chloroflexota bacterium]
MGELYRALFAALALVVIWPLQIALTAELSLAGTVAIDHADNFADHRDESYPMLELSSGERLELQNVSPEQIVPGSRVSVRGRRVGSNFYVDPGGIRPAGGGSVMAASTTATATMTKRVAVLMVNFVDPTPSPTSSPTPPPTALPTEPPPTVSAQPTDSPSPTQTPQPSDTPQPTATPQPTDTPAPTATSSPSPSPMPPPQPWTADFVRGVYFDNTRSVADYYGEVSNGQMSMSGDVFGWFTVPADTSACNHVDWGNAARAAATASGVDLNAYTNVAVVFPRQSACWWVGMAQLPGRYSYVNGSAGWTTATWLFTPTHELGHNYGMNHASTLSCTSLGARVAFSDNCTLDEYGDPYDTMGGNGQRHFNTWHRWQIGLFSASDVLTVTTTGTFTIAPAEADGDAPRVVRIARPSGNYFYLEYRQPYGKYDNFQSAAAVVNGVSIRMAAGVTSQSFSKLLDTNPQTATFFDSALGLGRGFADNIADIYVVTTGLSPDGATVYVQIGPDTNPPTAPSNLQTTVDASGAVALSWSAATDDLFVESYQLSRDGVLVGTTYGTSFVDANPPEAATHTYSVSSVDGAGNVGPTVVGEPVFVADTTKPGSPPSLSATATGPHSVVVAWKAASDNVGVTGYQVSRDGTPLARLPDTTYTDSAAPDGTGLTYQVRAVDAAGNIGPASSAHMSLTDVSPPTLTGALTLSVGPDGSIDVLWPFGSDNVSVTGYAISRDGVALTTVLDTAYSDRGLAQAANHSYSVVAMDAAGNASGALTGSIYLPDSTAPAAPSSLRATQSGPRTVNLAWSAASDNVGVEHYIVTLDGMAAGTTTDLKIVGIPAADGAVHELGVTAVDAAGNVGPAATAQLSLPDITAPTTPSTFSATPQGPTTVALSWAAATDNVSVAGYRLARDGVPVAELDAWARGYTDAGVASDRIHSYALTAVDGAGNVGPAASVQVTLTSVDVTAPTVPLNLRAVALSGRRISLSWTPSTDEHGGPLTYRVFRGRTRIATVATATYLDRPAVSGLYKYRVKAVDAAGNVSSFSAAVWITAHA